MRLTILIDPSNARRVIIFIECHRNPIAMIV
jgi:hypothetical protein